jgi:hypothetical protein
VIGNYKEVSGILMPHSLEAGPTGSSERQKITLEKIEINVPIDDARFAIPAKQKAPEPDSGRARERIGFDLN